MEKLTATGFFRRDAELVEKFFAEFQAKVFHKVFGL
jgi:hypothetical protein